ncbi:MAG: T9SS type A sorting domain-containing protein [Melioribacteraceae bacterium]|nr:T9SS type A sorting domain-containing protein [Melioribacteraceae bacterium]
MKSLNNTRSSRYSRNDNYEVSLKIYDILGNKIKSLVNENQAPGSYKIQFDAGNFVSGIYFYQLAVSDFIETKK